MIYSLNKILRMMPTMFRRSAVLFLGIVLITVSSFSPLLPEMNPIARAISECDKFAVDKGSLLTDNKLCIDPCAAPAAIPSAPRPNTPGSVYIIGDSLGNGLLNFGGPLQTKLGSEWQVSGSVQDGRPLSVGIGEASKTPPSAKYVLVVQGSNYDAAKNTPAGIAEMVSAIKAVNSGATIFWLSTNLVKGTLIDDNEVAKGREFNNHLDQASGINVIRNTITPSSDGVHPANYTGLAELISNAIKGGGSPVATPATGGSPATPTANLSLRDKLAMLIFTRANSEAEIKAASALKVGGIFVRPADKNDSGTYNSIKGSLAGATPFIAVDYEGGRVQAPGEGITGKLPSARELGQKTEAEIKEIAKEKGAKLKALGITMDFAPVLDIGGTNNAVIGDRAFGNDATTVSKKAAAFADGLAEAGVISTLKHFPGHGSTEGDSHKQPVRTKSLGELEVRDIKPFKDLSSKTKTAIMTGHLLVPEWGGQATSLNPKTYEYIRSVMNYKGVVVTDALDMQGISTPADQPGRALAALQAGADMALLNSAAQSAPTLQRLESAAAAGQLSAERIDQSVARITQLKNQIDTPSETSTQPASCSPCSVGGTVPIDGENAKRAFQFFVSAGYKAEWAAGIVGNMIAESGAQPQRLQGTASGVITQASTAVGSSLGYGLVQWTPAGKMINAVGVDKADDFAVQLDFLHKQLEGTAPSSNEKAAGTHLKSTTTVDEAAASFMLKYERPKDQSSSHVAKRASLARSVYDQYKALAPSAPVEPSGQACNEGAAGSASVVGELAWPVDVSFWKSNPNWFTKPHHDYPAADIPVPTGSQIYSLTSGTVAFVTTGEGGGCGTGLAITQGANQISYCHGVPGSLEVEAGQTVTAGQKLFKSNNTGRSSGPHLHLAIKVNGVKHCPQQLFEKMGRNETKIDIAALPTSGCTN